MGQTPERLCQIGRYSYTTIPLPKGNPERPLGRDLCRDGRVTGRSTAENDPKGARSLSLQWS